MPVTDIPYPYEAFQGMRATNDWTLDPKTGKPWARPLDWRSALLKLDPNGDGFLTALTSRMESQKCTDPEFKWMFERFAFQQGDITALLSDPTGTAYAGGAVKGDLIYINASAEVCSHFVRGSSILIRQKAPADGSPAHVYDAQGRVQAVEIRGTNSYLAVKLLYVPPNVEITNNDFIVNIGSIRPEGGAMPDSIDYEPCYRSNLTQIFVDSLEMTRTAMETQLRFGKGKARLQAATLNRHTLAMDRALIFNRVMSEERGENGKPERTTLGLYGMILNEYLDPDTPEIYKPTVMDFRTDPDIPAGTTWLAGGEYFLDRAITRIHRWGNKHRIALTDQNSLVGISQLVKATGNFEFKPTTNEYGINITKWSIAGHSLSMKQHSLFNFSPPDQGTILVFVPAFLKYRYITDTKFIKGDLGKNTGHAWLDGIKEAYLTEAGLEMHHPVCCGIITGIGKDHV